MGSFTLIGYRRSISFFIAETFLSLFSNYIMYRSKGKPVWTSRQTVIHRSTISSTSHLINRSGFYCWDTFIKCFVSLAEINPFWIPDKSVSRTFRFQGFSLQHTMSSPDICLPVKDFSPLIHFFFFSFTPRNSPSMWASPPGFIPDTQTPDGPQPSDYHPNLNNAADLSPRISTQF